ncbi:MAG TPA: sigma-70 family RNA polymerase sigma factor [Candidatus Sulfotelmatobacter sp.]|nr:sigma-70 family RNA polymerase sigma factor [Candidatus Sulfotelmatobacter sp.]
MPQQVPTRRTFSLQKFLNKSNRRAVFMYEGKRVVAGEAILNIVTTAERDDVSPRVVTIEELVREHSRLVYRIAYAVLRSHHDAEDATQETFMRVLRYSSKLDQIEDPKPWLARIAWRVAVDRGRQRGSHREVPLEDPDNPLAEISSDTALADETAVAA